MLLGRRYKSLAGRSASEMSRLVVERLRVLDGEKSGGVRTQVEV